MEDIMITTNRLIITTFQEEMAESVYLNSLDEDTRTFVPDEVFAGEQEAREVIRFLMRCYKGLEGPFVYPVLLTSGECIGYVQAVHMGSEWEVGYHIASQHTGRGYATEALTAFLPVIMAKLNIEEIWGICRSDNGASRRVLEKCGFELVFSGTDHYAGQSCRVCKYVYRGTERL